MTSNAHSTLESVSLKDNVDFGNEKYSKSVMPDMTDSSIMNSFSKSSDTANLHMVAFFDSADKTGEQNTEKEDPLGQTKEQREARERVVKGTADLIGKFKFDGPGKAITAAAMEHQFNHGGGAKAVDALAKDISDKLPDGMKLEITKDPAFEKLVRDSLRPGQPMPEYIRKVELKDKAGKVIGSFGATISKPAAQPPARRDRVA